MGKQESIAPMLEYARDLARAERELEIVPWVRIYIEYQTDRCERVRLFVYDLPKEVYERRQWVIRWRQAHLQCLYPREVIKRYVSPYDKKTGLRTDFNSCLSKLAASKAQITKAERSQAAYIEAQRKKYPLFYDETEDPDLQKFREKLAQKKKNYTRNYDELMLKVEEHKRGLSQQREVPIPATGVPTVNTVRSAGL